VRSVAFSKPKTKKKQKDPKNKYQKNYQKIINTNYHNKFQKYQMKSKKFQSCFGGNQKKIKKIEKFKLIQRFSKKS
jgi:DNA polymerase III delta subunit